MLVDGDAVIYESAIIDEYLEEKFPEPPLMPRDPTARARVRIWVDFCNTRLQAAGSDVAHDNDPEKAKEKVRQYLAILDREMANREYIAGDYSLADITFIPFFTRQQRYGVAIDGGTPHLKSWMERLLARPAVSATL
ncbi:MAG: glutathione S-transferase family protein [Deltaproteobacteria bacterium]|nr:glutathione S-transferase family protein [Deltaproteobacteria bacterium]